MLAMLIASAIPLYLVWSALCLFQNVQRARSTGLKVVISPISARNPVWMIFQDLLIPILDKLGVDTESALKLTKRSWNFHDRYQMHQKYGKAFAHATPSEVEIYVADPASSDELLARKKDFVKPMDMVGIINIYGPTVASTDGPDWFRHRRITATPFNERNNRIVWSESVKQTSQMLSYFTNKVGSVGSTALGEDTMTLTLHILTSAGLGFSYDFRGALENGKQENAEEEGHTLSYRNCLAAVLEDFIMMALLPKKIWVLPWLPKKWQKFWMYKQELKSYMVEMVEKTRNESSEHANLLSVLVRKNDEARQLKEVDPDAGVKRGLSDDELYGNIFIYSFAGHETTAHAVCYAMYFLAAYPEVQDWVSDEAKDVFKDVQTPEALSYEEVFPRLKRTLSVMYETLRLFPPVLNIPKTTGSFPQDLKVDGKIATLPPYTIVFPNVVALQSHPAYWGPDSLDWKPARWIESANDGEAESIRTPTKGTFIPWGDGPRICPGRKFSQVEFVAVIASMLWRHRIEVVPEEGEGFAEAKARIMEVMNDASEGVTLFMRNPEKVRVRVVER
ncbi:cytochrome P450 monooxygenase-like protein [Macrophomina phaseolina]|uniref:Cytochrome P450 monooxygenase-like protein n=1 Tax=Macrophomina phaseolina TaxID=35725 RepID=A0ABQ8GSF5_9PEZI|nr:cytochrome P450 monooxygenase-like protein [Macrophomina phaseolina]